MAMSAARSANSSRPGGGSNAVAKPCTAAISTTRWRSPRSGEPTILERVGDIDAGQSPAFSDIAKLAVLSFSENRWNRLAGAEGDVLIGKGAKRVFLRSRYE